MNKLKGGVFGGRSDTAILGYDTVAYFIEGKPIKGGMRSNKPISEVTLPARPSVTQLHRVTSMI